MVMGVTAFKGFSKLLLRLNRLTLLPNCTRLLIGRGAILCMQSCMLTRPCCLKRSSSLRMPIFFILDQNISSLYL